MKEVKLCNILLFGKWQRNENYIYTPEEQVNLHLDLEKEYYCKYNFSLKELNREESNRKYVIKFLYRGGVFRPMYLDSTYINVN